MSAPAALAASTFLPEVNTATRRVLPVPFGITVEPRTCWSDLLASMPRFTAASTLSLNLAVANSFTSFSASSTGQDLPGGSFETHTFCFFGSFPLVAVAISDTLHIDAHAAGGAGDRAHGGFKIGSGEIRSLHLRDLFELLARNLPHLVGVGRAAALLDAERLADQDRRRRRLHHEGEAAIAVHHDDHRDRQALLHLLGLRVELLAELHDVHALLTQCGPDGRRGVCRARRHLQLDIAVYLLSHLRLLGSSGSPLVLSLPMVERPGRHTT